MKKLIALTMALLMLAFVGVGIAEAAGAAEVRTLREGKYIVGEDIEAGVYTLTCTATAGEQMKDAYGSLGSAFDALDGDGGYSSLFGALGGMMEGVIDMTVEIGGDYGRRQLHDHRASMTVWTERQQGRPMDWGRPCCCLSLTYLTKARQNGFSLYICARV